MLALIIAALLQLGVISSESEYTPDLYQANQQQVDIIIDDYNMD